jgi:hypothetical protein
MGKVELNTPLVHLLNLPACNARFLKSFQESVFKEASTALDQKPNLFSIGNSFL